MTLVVGVCAGPSDRFEQIARPALDALHATVVFRIGAVSIARAYNAMIDEGRTLDDFEGMVFIHDDVELLDAAFEEKIRDGFAEADLVGVIGGVGLGPTMSWSDAEHLYGWATDDRRERNYGPAPEGGVHAIDGILLALSPRACRELRFDESIGGFHGYDADICKQARAADMHIALRHVRLHHHNGERSTDMRAWGAANERWRLKWRSLTPAQRLRSHWRLARYRLGV